MGVAWGTASRCELLETTGTAGAAFNTTLALAGVSPREGVSLIPPDDLYL